MRSKWFEIKPKAIELRHSGKSLRDIEKTLKIPKSTLSGWFKKIVLNEQQKNILRESWLSGLSKARTKAIIWHNQQKETRILEARNLAIKSLSKMDINDISIVELAVAMLYLGEGSKKHGTIIGNSNPLILKFFIRALIRVYDFDVNKIKCELHLRADQDPDKVKKYWSKELKLPLSFFYPVSIDKRTHGSSTYPHYNGVCILHCGNIAIQRRLVFISELFCKKLINKRAVSSVGRASA